MIVKKIRINYVNQSVNSFIDVEFNKNDYINSRVMGDNELIINFSLAYYFEFAPETTYIDFTHNSVTTRYYLFDSVQPKKNNSESFDYSLRFETEQGKLKKWIIRNLVDNRIKFSISSTPLQILQLIVDNCNSRNTGWTVGSCIDVAGKTISFNSTNIIDALQMLADTFETEWYITNKVISIGKEGENITTPLSISYGSGYGVKPIIERRNTDQKPIGKLYVQGGEKNINATTYGNKTLLLPKNQTIWYNGEDFVETLGNFGQARQYLVDSLGISIKRVGLLSTDREESIDLSNIYPQRVGEVSSVVVSTFQNSYYQNYWQHPSQIEPFYDIIDSSIPSSLDYWSSAIRLAGQVLSITFQTGNLAGRTFDVAGYIHSERKFQLVSVNEDGVNYPNTTFAPQVGDKYIVFGCALPNAYISDNHSKTGASWEMLKEAVKFLWEREDQQVTFTLPIDEIWLRSTGNIIKKGDFINFIDSDFSPNGVKIRVISLKQYLSNPYKIELTLSNVRVDRRFRRQRNIIDVLDETLTTHNRDIVSLNERASFQNFVGGRDALTRLTANKKAINTKNKRLTTLVDEKNASLLSFFADNKQEPISVAPKIEFDGNLLLLTEQQVIFDYDKTTSYQLEPQEFQLDTTDIQYLYAVCDTKTYNGTIKAYNDLQSFVDEVDSDLRNYLIGYVNPVIDEAPTIEYTYLGDKKLGSGTIKPTPIPVNSEDRYKYINHRLGRKPDVQLIDESGEIRYVQVIHLSDDSMQLSWVGSIVGNIIIE